MKMGLMNPEGQRVTQMVHIVRNFLVDEENVSVLSSSIPLFRFLLLCVHCKYGSVRQSSLEALVYLSPKLTLEPMDCKMTQLVTTTMHKCLHSSDKYEIIKGSEMLCQLSQLSVNEDCLCNCITDATYSAFFDRLTLNDLHLVYASLEALYQLSEIDILIDLLTLDVDKNLIQTSSNLENVFAVANGNSNSITAAIATAATTAATFVVGGPDNDVEDVAGARKKLKISGLVTNNNNINNNNNSVPVSFVVQCADNNNNNNNNNNSNNNKISASNSDNNKDETLNANSQSKLSIQLNDNEMVACNWLLAQYEYSNADLNINYVSKMEIYRAYVGECSTFGLQKIVSPASFEKCININNNNNNNNFNNNIINNINNNNNIIINNNNNNNILNNINNNNCNNTNVQATLNPGLRNTSQFPSIENALSGKTVSNVTSNNNINNNNINNININVSNVKQQQQQTTSTTDNLLDGLDKDLLAVARDIGIAIPLFLANNSNINSSLAMFSSTQQQQQQQQLLANNLNALLGNQQNQQQQHINIATNVEIKSTTTSTTTNVNFLAAQLIKQSQLTNQIPTPPTQPILQAGDKRHQPITGGGADAAKRMKMSVTNRIFCRWIGCNKPFDSSYHVQQHVIQQHLQQPDSNDSYVCRWLGICDNTPRKKWSFVSHLNERHLNQNSSILSGPPNNGPPTIYPPNAAMQAIRRFCIKPPFTELHETELNPVTRHVHLTSALVLRNLARYSPLGRSLLKKNESRIASIALSTSESSSALSNCLWELQNFKSL
ncbi:hypothetical protein HELRODRAFT_195033 [Helobdella robusta]|uniref:C2H2-type domain-containing protein n=1 Tax=Helobdella robusta TaxID=6412 RepID=T1FWP1_HELRO|nr:hypothetical protein HELRODRAFT_195033 [Helobdella robusta]ESO09732.1 hypothetical protein HELRODRAFT_195033 [Helobdella robusta]